MKDFVLRLCLRAYPRASRARDGRVILDLARDLSQKSPFSFLLEAGGLLIGGLGGHGKLLRLDVTQAPWRAARERLALPLAVGILCLLVAFTASLPHGQWRLLWASVTLTVAAGTVFAVASRRRLAATVTSFALLGLMLLPLLFEYVGHAAMWSGAIPRIPPRGGAAVDVFVLWIPAAVLLPVCARAVGSSRVARRRGAPWMICAAVAASALSGLVPRLLPAHWVPFWSDWLGGAFVWAPLLLLAATIVMSFVARDPAAKTAAALMVIAGSFPVVWVLPALIPISVIPTSWFSSSFWFLCYAPPVVAICFVMWLLLRRRPHIAA